MGELSCAIDRELLDSFLAACRTYDSPVSPLGRAHRADQRSLRPIPLGTQYAHDRFCRTKGTNRQGLLARSVSIVIGLVLGLGLQKVPRQEIFGLSGTGLEVRRGSPEGSQQIFP